MIHPSLANDIALTIALVMMFVALIEQIALRHTVSAILCASNACLIVAAVVFGAFN